MNIRIEKWQGRQIRFVEIDGEYWAILEDLCKALGLKSFNVKSRLDDSMRKTVALEMGEKKFQKTTAVNELGIYQILFTSRRPEAEQLKRWTGTVLQRLRKHVGLQSYEIMRMTETEVQEDINHMLDDLWYDEETKKLMTSRTVQGGDVEVYEFEDQDLFKE